MTALISVVEVDDAPAGTLEPCVHRDPVPCGEPADYVVRVLCDGTSTEVCDIAAPVCIGHVDCVVERLDSGRVQCRRHREPVSVVDVRPHGQSVL